jgi:hypothetical protein
MKRILLAFVTFLIMFVACACDRNESYILFHKHPFTPDTIAGSTNVFKPNERIYYLITTPKPVESKRLLIQVVKKGSEERLGYDLVWGKQVKIRDEQVYYYTDYVVFSEKGAYTMKVYSKDNPTKILTSNDFYIRN